MKDKDLCMMMLEGNRIKSFKNWPFHSDSCMGKDKMAAAGFFFIGSKKEPDLAKCYVCLKELDGWEEEDSPWEEHKKHAPYCHFVKIDKQPSELTLQDTHDLEMHRNINIATKVLSKKILEFKKQAEKTREIFTDLV